jgi:trehalose 6-phosphate synthase
VDIVVSNRVARTSPGGPVVGGLASALLPAVKKSGVVWFGSSDNVRKIAPGATPLARLETYGRGTIATVDLPEQHYAGFYEGFANSTLWPLLHSRGDLSRYSVQDFAAYTEVNAYMARTLATFAHQESTFWIHDYHFLPLGRELRKLGSHQRIGFFLHTPWPNRRTMAPLPQLRELAEAMLAYDLIGFQTDQDRDNFAELVRSELHLPGNGLVFKSRYGTCRIGTFPIGIDTEQFADSAQRSVADPEVQRLRNSLVGSRLILGVDRVDYSKGLEPRLRAIDHLLTQHPGLKRQITMLQVANPSRSCIEIYRKLQHDLAGLVGEINGRHGEVDWAAIRYVNRGYSQATLAGFYRTAAVCLVTPVQDGMNLVAKEFVAAQDPVDPGVLVLSKFAGAAQELDAALMIEPQDVEGISRQISVALAMPREERRLRWQRMMDTLLNHSIHGWFSQFLAELKSPQRDNVIPLVAPSVTAIRKVVNDAPLAAHPDY